MRYEYSGFLKTLLDAPDPTVRDSLEQIVITPEDLDQWQLIDNETDKEWQHIPARRERTQQGVQLQGNFEEVRRIDNLSKDDPSFWVPLSSIYWKDERFPIDLSRFPIVEITYRCHTPDARPAWLGHYPSAVYFDGLQPTREWRTIARRVQHCGFPEVFTGLTFRLYSTARRTESFELGELRFRAMSPREQKAFDKHQVVLAEQGPPKHYKLLEEFMPLGVFMKASSAKRLADMMEISFRDYWRLSFEDVARHHHNTVGIEDMEQLTQAEWRELLGLAENAGLRLVAMHDWPLDSFRRQGKALVAEHIAPYADAPALLAHTIQNEPPDHSFQAHLDARKLMEEADPNHPLAVIMRDPNSLPLFAPYFAASGISHFKSNSAWNMGQVVRSHYPLCGGQQFWVSAPTFVYATDTPEWYTCPEMRLMLNLAFSNGARGWFSFAYHNDPVWAGGNTQRSLTGPFLTFSDLWAELGHRMERYYAMAPLILNATPIQAPKDGFTVSWQVHPRSRLPEHIEPIRNYWLQGPDYQLLYIVSSDINEVTPVNVTVSEHLPAGTEVYDITDFTRSRHWEPMQRERHIESFPGQGHVLLLAEPHAAEKWRGLIVERMIENDRRQIALDLSVARRYDLAISDVQQIMQEIGTGLSGGLDDLRKMQDARDRLLNALYGSQTLTAPRSKLVQASSIVCALDGALCRLLGKGKIDLAHEKGVEVIALTSELAQLRLKLRRGRGTEIDKPCLELVRRGQKLLAEIRALA